MYTRTWTLEERERLAYITNSPDHSLLVEAIEGDEEKITELKEERDHFERLANDEEKRADLTQEDLEAAEERNVILSGRVEDLEIKVGDLEEMIHNAGVDLV